MAIRLIVVGKCKGEEQALQERYEKRLTSLKVQKIVLSDRGTKEEQGKRIIETIGCKKPMKSLCCWLWDSQGLLYTTQDLASHMEKTIAIHKEITMVVGGSDGFSKDVYAEATEKISLGRMTLPHQWVQALVLEQLYRCQCLYKGHPYHH